MDKKELKAEVMDLLNQIVILTKGIKAPESGVEDYDCREVSVLDLMDHPEDYLEEDPEALAKWKGLSKNEKDELKMNVYLSSVHAMAKRVVDGKASSAEYNEKQYYNSNCY
jgi:hypothetical protein